MKTIRRLIHGEIIRAVSFVVLGFLALFVFFDLVDQLQTLSRNKFQGYQIQHALMYVALLMQAIFTNCSPSLCSLAPFLSWHALRKVLNSPF